MLLDYNYVGLVDMTLCPFCTPNEIAWLQSEERTLNVKEEPVTGTCYFYQCTKCGEQFTTTESDTISLNNFKEI